jgi:hypothetical protein
MRRLASLCLRPAWPLLLLLGVLLFAAACDEEHDDPGAAPRTTQPLGYSQQKQIAPYTSFLLDDCKLENADRFELRVFDNLVLPIASPVNPDDEDHPIVTPFEATSSVDVDESDSGRQYAGKYSAKVVGEYVWNQGIVRGKLTYEEHGSWTKPEEGGERKCVFDVVFQGDFEAPAEDMGGGPTPGSTVKISVPGKKITDETYTWSKDRHNEDHYDQDYAYILTFTVFTNAR